MLDKRYKVDQFVVNEMRLCREAGMSYQKIADDFEVSYSTALYWTNDEQREKQRAKIAKRRKKGKELEKSMEVDMERRKKLLQTDKKAKLKHAIESANNETRSKRHKVLGIKLDEANELLKSGKLHRKNSKIQ
tara:strand:+ start:731 stop:1129 length:399 start_codon:yes stop_codon:yes gene_type:complete